MRTFGRFVFLLLLVAAGAAYALYGRMSTPYQGWTGSETFVAFPPGVGTRVIGDRLVAAGVVSDPLTFRAALWQSGSARRLKAGEYRFDHPMTPAEVIEKMARGDVYVINLTFPEGRTILEMAQIFEMHGFGPASAFVSAAADASAVHGLDPAAGDLEGYLFPDTYALLRHTEATTLVHLMVSRFEHALTPERRAEAKARGLSMRALITLASIVEKETGNAEERPQVAAVYENRLRIGMGLQCDPTVIYALEKAGKYTGNLRRDDLRMDSPYNTYRYPGLPPGPIASPGSASIDAVLHPADVDYLYFVSRNDGSHAFSKTLAEHNRNVQKYQVAYFRAKHH